MSWQPLPNAEHVPLSLGSPWVAFDAPNCQVDTVYIYVCVCRIICSSGLLFLGNSGRLIDCSRLAAMMRMMMICNSFFLYFFFGQHREIRLNSRVIKLCYQRSVGHVTFLSFSAFPHSLPFPFSCLPPFLLCNFL